LKKNLIFFLTYTRGVWYIYKKNGQNFREYISGRIPEIQNTKSPPPFGERARVRGYFQRRGGN
jgi:hypothetical protein